MSLATADDFQFVTVKRKKATILTCLPRNFEYSSKILKQTAGNGPVYIRLTASLIKQSRVTSSPLSNDSDFELPDASSIYNKSKPKVLLIPDNSDDDSDFELPPSVPSTSRGHNRSYQSLSLQCSTPKTVQSTTYTPLPSSNTSNTLQSPLPVSTETPTSRGRNRSYRSLSLHRSTSTVQPTPSPISCTSNTLQLPSPLPVSETPSNSRGRNHSYQSSSLHQSTSTVQPTPSPISSTSNTYSHHHHYQYQLRLHQLQEVAIIHTNLYHSIIQHQQFNQLLALAIH